jgi:glycosyltransferase involved in cell wall biosynthesis
MPDGYLAWLFSMRYQIPYIVTFRNADVKFLRNLDPRSPDMKKAKLVASNAARILTLNKAYKDYVDDLFGVDSLIIPHGIKEEIFTDDQKKKSEKTVIGVVAKAIKRKNIDWVINAIKTYNGQRDILLNIIGDGPLLDDLKKLAEGDDRIHFKGKLAIEDVLEISREGDIFALPSADETFGMVYLEAAANHNAMIGLQNEGVWGVFEDGKEMLFSKDESDFQQLLHGLIDNKTQQNTLAENAFAKAQQLTWPVITKKYEDLYTEVRIESKKKQANKSFETD